MARMKVVLRQAVDKLGEAGDQVTVAGGFARNYLIPRGLAVPATKGNLKQASDWQNSRSAKRAREERTAAGLKVKLESSTLRVTAQAGPDGRLFGSITAADVSGAIATAHGLEIDRHRIELAEPIRHLGVHTVRVPLMPDVVADVTVEVSAAQ